MKGTSGARMRFLPSLIATLFVAVASPSASAEDEVKGEWFTDPEAGLAAAAEAEKPVLAVAMDHG